MTTTATLTATSTTTEHNKQAKEHTKTEVQCTRTSKYYIHYVRRCGKTNHSLNVHILISCVNRARHCQNLIEIQKRDAR